MVFDFDINDYELVTEVLFDTLKINEIYCIEVSEFYKNLKEQCSEHVRYIKLKAKLIKGKLNQCETGNLIEIHLPSSAYNKLKRCPRNVKTIQLKDTVRMQFIKRSVKKWDISKLEVM